MYVQENLTTTPHEVLGISWKLPEELAEKFWSLGAFAKLVLDENRTCITDIIEDIEKREKAEAEAAQEEAEEVEIKEKREKLVKAAILEEQGVKTLARVLFRNVAPQMSANEVITCRALATEWEPGNYAVGDVRNFNNIPFRCVQEHDSAENPNWNPFEAPALWASYHGTTSETALPWVQPTGMHDMYKKGEYMIWMNDTLYRAVQDTNFSPEEFPNAWEEVI